MAREIADATHVAWLTQIGETDYWFPRKLPATELSPYSKLKTMGFHQTYLKFQAQVFAEQYAKILAKEGYTVRRDSNAAPNCKHIWIWWALFNGQPCVCFVPYLDEKTPAIRYEIQIQRHQYRRLIAGEPYKGKTGVKPKTEGYGKLWDAIHGSNGLDWFFAKDCEDLVFAAYFCHLTWHPMTLFWLQATPSRHLALERQKANYA